MIKKEMSATMKKTGKDFIYYPDDMDRDMIFICDALNSLDGVRTFFCCSGHGRGNDGDFYISLGCSNMRSLKHILKCFNVRRRGVISEVWKPYVLEPADDFWPLRKNEISIRISNKCIDHLKYGKRKRELGRIAKELMEGNS